MPDCAVELRKNKVTGLLKNAGILALGNFSSKALIFLLVPLYTAVLTTEEYGIYDVVYNTAVLLIPLLTFNIAEAMMRFPLDEGADSSRIARIGLGITIASGILVCLVQIIPDMPWSAQRGVEYFGLLYLANALYTDLSYLARGLNRMADVAWAGVISAASMLILNILFLVVFNLGLDGYFLANSFAFILPFLWLLFRMRKVVFGKSLNSDPLLGKMIRYAYPLAASTVGWWLVNVSDRYIVLAICGADANGLYSAATKLPSVLSTVAVIFIQAWQVSVVKSFDKRDASGFYRKAFDVMESYIVLLCSVLIALSPFIASFMLSGDFYLGWQYTPFLFVYALFNTMGGIFGPFFSAKFDTKPLIVSTLLGGVVNVVAGIPLVWLLGIQGAALSSLLSGVVGWAYRGYRVRRHVEVDFHFRQSFVVYSVLIVQAMVMVAGLPMEVWLPLQIVMFFGFVLVFRKNLAGSIRFFSKILKRKRYR